MGRPESSAPTPHPPQLLHLSLKTSKVTSESERALEMLDPFVSLLISCLDSREVKVSGGSACRKKAGHSHAVDLCA